MDSIEEIITDKYIKDGINDRGEHYIYLDKKALAKTLRRKVVKELIGRLPKEEISISGRFFEGWNIYRQQVIKVLENWEKSDGEEKF